MIKLLAQAIDIRSLVFYLSARNAKQFFIRNIICVCDRTCRMRVRIADQYSVSIAPVATRRATRIYNVACRRKGKKFLSFTSPIHTARAEHIFFSHFRGKLTVSAGNVCEMSSTVHHDGLSVFGKTAVRRPFDGAPFEGGERVRVRGIPRTERKNSSESGKIHFFEIRLGERRARS